MKLILIYILGLVKSIGSYKPIDQSWKFGICSVIYDQYIWLGGIMCVQYVQTVCVYCLYPWVTNEWFMVLISHTEVLCTPNSIRPGFKLMAFRSWTVHCMSLKCWPEPLSHQRLQKWMFSQPCVMLQFSVNQLNHIFATRDLSSCLSVFVPFLLKPWSFSFISLDLLIQHVLMKGHTCPLCYFGIV